MEHVGDFLPATSNEIEEEYEPFQNHAEIDLYKDCINMPKTCLSTDEDDSDSDDTFYDEEVEEVIFE